MKEAATPGMSLNDIAEIRIQAFLKLSPAERKKANEELVAEARAYLQTHPQPKPR